MKGVFPFRKIESDSRVWGSSPCIMSTTRMAMSHMEEPRTRRLLKGEGGEGRGEEGGGRGRGREGEGGGRGRGEEGEGRGRGRVMVRKGIGREGEGGRGKVKEREGERGGSGREEGIIIQTEVVQTLAGRSN